MVNEEPVESEMKENALWLMANLSVDPKNKLEMHSPDLTEVLLRAFAEESNEISKERIICVFKNFTYDSSICEELKQTKVDALLKKVSHGKGENDGSTWNLTNTHVKIVLRGLR